MARGGRAIRHALSATMLLWASAASAQGGMVWRAPAECPNAAQAELEIARLAQRSPGAAAVSAPSVVITRTSATQLQASISLAASDGVREHVLHDASCEALTRAAALVVAMAIDRSSEPSASARKSRPAASAAPLGPAAVRPGAASRDDSALPAPPLGPAAARPEAVSRDDSARDVHGAEGPPVRAVEAADAGQRSEVTRFEVSLRSQSQEPEARSSERAAPPSAADAARDRADAPRDPERADVASALGVFVGVAGGLSSGIVPGVAPMVGVHFGASLGVWRAALRFGYAPAQSAHVQAASGAAGRVALALAALEGGVGLQGFGLEFPVLVGVEPGLFFASARGLAHNEARVSEWLAGYLSPGVSRTWGRVRVFARVDGLLALRRPRFAIDATPGVLVFHQPERVSARLYLGLDVILR